MSLHNLKIVDLTKIIKHKQTTNKTYSRKNIPFICNRGLSAWDNGCIAELKYRVLLIGGSAVQTIY